MIVLGIDPGTTSIGYALIEGTRRESPRLIDAGLFSITAGARAAQLAELHQALETLIQEWRPQTLAVERVFFAKNAKTALEVAEARGVILLTAQKAGLTLYEYTPLEAKKILTGDGRADKKQVHKMVNLTLPETAALKARDDVFDAIALALACYFRDNQGRNTGKIK